VTDRTNYLYAEDSNHELHKVWWLYVPILFFGIRYAVALFTNASSGLESWFRHELGIIENLTVVLLAMAIFITLGMIVRFKKLLDPLLKAFLVLFLIGLIYFAGEEASWGQHWFGWETSETFLKINAQKETNLHNTSNWFDRVPKGIVSFLIFIGGIVIPVLFYYKSWKIDYQSRWWWWYPTLVCTPTAIFATITTWPSKIERLSGWDFYFSQAQETKELYIAYFFLLFIVSLKLRFTRTQHNSGTAPGISADNNV
jgi:hypothetical protein